MSKRLIRFDWAIKKLLRNKANFAVLEGFLSELLFDDIRIEKILESEDKHYKRSFSFNRIIILSQNTQKEEIIVSIQNLYEIDFLRQSAFSTSETILEYLDLDHDCANIKKIISINILYFFDLGYGEDYVYKGLTNFHGLYQKDALELSDKKKAGFYKRAGSRNLG